jgi:2-polyprenyl-3-methyl-5-hydroxy-6-metoxy-1,4-benzoquinol methylase
MIEESELFDGYDEDARLLSRRGRVEYLSPCASSKNTSSRARVCEIGAGTGRVQSRGARMGLRVDAVELLPAH